MSECEGCGRDQDKHDHVEKHECGLLAEGLLLEKQGDLQGALAKWKTYAKEVRRRRDMWEETADSRQKEIDVLEAALSKCENDLIKKSIVFETFDGIKYMRIPDPVQVDVPNDMVTGRHKQSCSTVWFRTGIEKEIASGNIPKDFMRCPKCGGNEFEHYDGDSFGDTTCVSCAGVTSDLGWAWMNLLFPDPTVRSKVDNNDVVKRV